MQIESDSTGKEPSCYLIQHYLNNLTDNEQLAILKKSSLDGILGDIDGRKI